MEIWGRTCLILVMVTVVAGRTFDNTPDYYYCDSSTRCGGKSIECPAQCPKLVYPSPTQQACYVNCNSPVCRPSCKSRIAYCQIPGSICDDPRFIGGDGVVFYFHGRKNQHFSLVSDSDLQINGHFIGHRPAGRPRDFTWIQALGVLFNSHTFSLEATQAATWDAEVDHLKFTYNGEDLVVPEESLYVWYSPEKDIKVERVTSKNSVIVTFKNAVEILVNVVPVTKKDDRIHNYQIPANDCFVHFQSQFSFFNLSPKVDGVLGRTYRPDFVNPAKLGEAMPVLGGEEKYRIPSLFSSDCQTCIFSPQQSRNETSSAMNYATLDCTSAGYGIVCKK